MFFQMEKLIKDFCFYARYTLNRCQDAVDHHFYNLRQFLEYTKARKGTLIINQEDITFKDCIDFLSHYRSTPVQYWPNKWQLPAQNTMCWKTNSIRAFFQYVRSIGLPGFNREMIPKLQKSKATIDMMKPEEYEVFRQAPLWYEKTEVIALRNQLLIDIPYTTWLRRSEVLRCTFEGFNSPNRQFDILWKWGYIDAVFFTEELREQVVRYKEELMNFSKYKPIDSDFIFVGLDNRNYGRPLIPNWVNRIFSRYSKKLLEEWKITRILKPHMERHSFATNCVFSWLSQQATTKLMRHRDPKTTLRYYHLDNDRLRGEFDKLKR